MEPEFKCKRIKLSEVSSYIGQKDIKSVHGWCNANKVNVYVVGNRKYVCLQQVKDALEKEFIQAVQKEEPEKYLEICKEYVSTKTLEKYSFSASTRTYTTTTNQLTGDYPDDVRDFINKI